MDVEPDALSVIFAMYPMGVEISRARDGCIIRVNKAFLELFGYQEDELIGKDSHALGLWVDTGLRQHVIEQLSAGRAIERIEAQARHKNGDIHTVLVSANRTVLDNETCFLGLFVDISGVRRTQPQLPEPQMLSGDRETLGNRPPEQQQTDDTLREREAWLRLAVSASNVGLWDWDVTTDRVVFSKEYLAQLGESEDELTGNFSEWVARTHPDDIAPTMALVDRHLRGVDPEFVAEFRMRHRDGSYRWIYSRGVVWRSDTGKALRMMGCHIDITERKRIDSELKEVIGQVELALSTAGMGVWTWNLHSGRFERLRGKGPISGLPAGAFPTDINQYWALVHPDDQASVRQLVDRTIRTGEKFEKDYRVILPGQGVRHVFDSAHLIRDDAGKPWKLSGVDLDITELKAADALLRGQNDVLRLISSGSPLDDTLAALLGVVEAREPDLLGAFHVLDRTRDQLPCRAAPSLPPDYARLLDNLADGAEPTPSRVAIRQGQPVVVADLAESPAWAHAWSKLSALRLRACWSLPIADANGQALGTLCIYCRHPLLPAERHWALLEFAAKTAAIAIENANREEQLQFSLARMESLSRRLLTIQEDERRRLARELHDEIGQVLTAVGVSLKTAHIAASTPRLRDLLKDCIDTTDTAIQQVRNRSLQLRPTLLDDLGLVPAIRWYLDRQRELGVLEIDLIADPFPDRPAPAAEIACYRVLQECVTNALRHAAAKHLSVRLFADDNDLHLTVRDDGIGFHVASAQSRAALGGSLGLLSMAERATLAGGNLEIRSRPHLGTEIHAWFALREQGNGNEP